MAPGLSPELAEYFLFTGLAAQLPISTVGFIILGINICQSTFYFQNLAKRDHILTRAWAFIIGILTLASVLFQTYINWLYSIDSFIAGSTNHASVAIGTTVVLYSTVIMLAQFFWLSCIKKLLFTKPRMAWFVITPIAFVSLSSFVLAIAVAVISRLRPGPHGAWPTSEISILFRCALGLDLAVDISVLIVIVSQLALLKKSSGGLKTTITKLSWILCLSTFVSTVMVVGELYTSIPQSASHIAQVPVLLSFAPVIPAIYCASFYAVLNARDDLFLKKRRSPRQLNVTGSRGLIPGLRFTVDLPDSVARPQRQQQNTSEPVMTFVSTRPRSDESEPS